ncbi:hypothetical protein LCI18_011778 [Fusarium solani-melongenae]|uniref:Uncharacterized protein n=1 Tax=Fusarium solani subsp. cucurbitae TaxID=2747967 RepID=A0ACD3ZID4_FUSSC|nr:hypothetical protein LCI18_011778 [Fusarium solani-melongenae]
MLMNFETRHWIEKPGPVDGQEQSSFFQKLVPDVRRLIYLEVFGSRSVHVVLNASKIFLYTCRQPDDAPPHSECPDQTKVEEDADEPRCFRYNEGATLLFKSNKFLFPNQTDCTAFFREVPDSFQNSVRSLDICVQFDYCDTHLIQPMCEMLSNWTGDFKLRMRWDMDHAHERKRYENFNPALIAIQQLMENPRVRPKFWASKMLEGWTWMVLKKEDRLRLEFVKDESEPDPNDREWNDDGEEDEDEDEYDWDDDSQGYYEDDSDGCMTDVDHDEAKILRYWQALAGQA